jgi:hypothetical protein
MKTSLKMLLAASVLSSAGMVAAAPATAAVGFSFRVGDVALGYSDGYYDRSRHWHNWRNNRERDWYRSNYHTSYRSMRHDSDHDGIPNRFDRDRDNDGVPNNRDSAPNNPNRR